MKRLLTYGLLLLTILASHFVVSACQDDLPDTTEVMLTFTTRAFVSAEETGEKSDALAEESMKNLRVIMLDGDNNVVGNAVKENIEKSSVVFKFQTPVTIGEEFKFLAIANENSLGLENDLNAITTNLSAYENDWKKRVINVSLNPTAENPLPQTKFWTWTYGVDAEDSDKLNPTLDYIGCKISVQFVNHTTKPQSLSNIYIAGVSRGYLFKQDDNDFVGDASANINLLPINELPASKTSDAQHCYTYPKGNISSSPTLYATWNNVQYSLVLKDNQGNALTSLNRNDHLQIVVTLTDVGLDVTYTIVDWATEQPTYIGQSPSIGDDGYDIPDWDDTDIDIGGGDEPEPDEPDEPEVGEGEVEIWSGSCPINWSYSDGTGYLYIDSSWLENAATVTGPDNLSGIQMYVYYTGTGDMQIRNGNNDNNQYGELYINGGKNGYLSGLTGEKVSVFIPNEVKDTSFTFSGQNYTITKVTVIK